MNAPGDSLGSVDLDFDRQHIWHPYSSMNSPLPVYPVVSADGTRLRLADGRELIDGMASWWAAIHGYNHPILNQAATEQISKMSHVMFGGITHKPAIDLARLLLEITPSNLTKVFFSDSGSVAVEVAIKMALQYWGVQGKRTKVRLLTIRSGYHGDTFQAMSVCDPITGMHEMFHGTLVQQLFAPAPKCRFTDSWDDGDIEEFAALLEQNSKDIAAVILEPIVQGAGGMRFYHPEYLKCVRELCDEHDVLLIVDEIATGFGRTGKMFACEHAEIHPDILCLGKAMTGGYISLAATLASDQISDVIASGDKTGGVLMHGPTYMASPLASAIALASLRLLLQTRWQERIQEIQKNFEDNLLECRAAKGVKDARTLGGIGVIEMLDPVDVASAQRFFVKKGVWIRPFGNLVYVMPPYVITDEDLCVLCSAMCDFAET